jgi:hypothetical protein
MFRELTPHEAGRLDAALFDALISVDKVGQLDEPVQSPPHADIWDETADVIRDLRAEHEYMPPETASFRLDQA